MKLKHQQYQLILVAIVVACSSANEQGGKRCVSALALNSSDNAERATYELVTMGPDAAPVIADCLDRVDEVNSEQLVVALSLVDSTTVLRAVEIAGGLSPTAIIAVNESVLLRSVGERPMTGLAEFVLAHLRHPDSAVRNTAASGIALAIEPGNEAAMGPLAEALDVCSPTCSTAVAMALAKIGPSSLPALRDATRHPRPHVRRSAVLGIGRLAKTEPGATAVLIELLASDQTNVRWAAGEALARVGRNAAPAVPLLVKWLASPNKNDRWRATDALGGIGPEASSAIPQLVGLLGDPEAAKPAAEALGRLAPASVPILIDLLEDHDQRLPAMHGLAIAGPQAKAAVSGIRPVLDAEDEELRCQAAATLWAIGAHMPTSLDVLSKCDGRYAEVISRPGGDGNEVVQRLVSATRTPRLRSNAILALAELDGHAVRYVMAALEDSSPSVRTAMCQALERMGEQASMSTNLLITRLRDDDENVRIRAAYALAATGSRRPTALAEALLSALQNESASDVKRALLQALGRLDFKIGSRDLQKLRKGLDDPDPDVRRETLVTLVKLEQKQQ